MRRFIPVTAVVVAAMVLPVAGAGPAAAAPACGGLVLASAVLTADIGPCANGGLIIVGNDITLNLNGHRLFGTAQAGDGNGIEISGNRNVRIVNGSVTDFDNGIVLDATTDAVVGSMRVLRNVAGVGGGGVGIEVFGTAGTRIFATEIRGNGPVAGVYHYAASHATVIESSQVVSNAAGLALASGTSATVANSRITGNAGYGIELGDTMNGAVVRGNQIAANGFTGRPGVFGDGVHVHRARPPRPGFPFPVAGDHLIESNAVVRNAGTGIAVEATDTVIRRNYSSGNGAAGGALTGPAYDLLDFDPACTGNTWTGNAFGTAAPACAGAP